MPPSQRSVTNIAPQRSASSCTMAASCRLVQTKRMFSPRSDDVAHELLRELELAQRLLQVDDVDAVALGENEPAHLGVPPAGLVPEVDAGFQELFEVGLGHGDCREASGCVPPLPSPPVRDRRMAGTRARTREA